MAIVSLKKYLFIGVREDLDTFFERAQKKGCLQFISGAKKRTVDAPASVRKMMQALKILRKLPLKEPARDSDSIDMHEIASKAVEKKGQIERWLEEKLVLNAEIARISPLGDFSLESIEELKKMTQRSIQFFCVKKGKREKVPKSDELIYLNSDYDLDYFMSISAEPKRFAGMIEMHIEESLSALKEKKAEIKEAIARAQQELKELASYLKPLKEELIRDLNAYHLSFAIDQSESYLEGSLFAIEAWIPSSRLHLLFPLLEEIGVHGEEIAIEKDERVPTYMENKRYGAVGEDLVHIYDTPSPQDKDPSTWVFWSFVIFFAMIISDAGYGMLYLVTALFLRWKFPHLKGMGKRFLKLMTAIAVSCVLWGVLSGSYFGIDIAPKNPLNRVSLIYQLAVKKASYHLKHKDVEYQEWVERIPALAKVKRGEEFIENGVVIEGEKLSYKVLNDFGDSVFLEITLIVGVLHISLSLLRYVRRHYAGIGWTLAAIGGYLYFPDVLQSTSLIQILNILPKETAYLIGWQLLWVGIGLAILLALIQNKWFGFIEISKPIELFADILSYLRLYALGLAGMMLALTFNDLGREFGFPVLIGGHLINMTVGIMGGTIHGLRLNFIEWYHHSFEGGGKRFHPLQLLKVKGE